ncbi:MAG: tyrosine-type recombinase/integrase [Acidobacteria bacterium]|nr:tyrosine-type recombinase/integrase [Acidobacteriota bacterium]
MEIKDQVFKRKSGKSKGKWIARIEYFDDSVGRWKTMERSYDTKYSAGDERDRLIIEIKKSHGQIQTGERMTFSMLADMSSKGFYKPAVLANGRKIEGVRSHNTAMNHLKVLKQFFGKKMVGQITTQSLRDYRTWRFKIGSRHPSIKPGEKKEVSISTINRELSAMRRIMRHAYAQGWITKDIFFKSDVIQTSAEIARKRRLSEEEEVRLLAACQGEREKKYERTRFGKTESITAKTKVDNPHLKAIILLAIDAGLRRGEILKLRWVDIDFLANNILILGTNTKTEEERMVPLTERVKAELKRVKKFTPGNGLFRLQISKGAGIPRNQLLSLKTFIFTIFDAPLLLAGSCRAIQLPWPAKLPDTRTSLQP